MTTPRFRCSITFLLLAGLLATAHELVGRGWNTTPPPARARRYAMRRACRYPAGGRRSRSERWREDHAFLNSCPGPG